MARLQDFQTVTPTSSDKILIVQSQGQGLAPHTIKMDSANPTGTGALSINRKANTTVGVYSVAEGYQATASNTSSHAEGYQTTASGDSSHAEGNSSTASGTYSHAEGFNATASGSYSHAEGTNTTASGLRSHAEGAYTTANHQSQHVFGEFNVADASTAAATARGNYVEIVGNGANASNRSNARTLDWSGNEVLAGDLTINGSTSVGTALNTISAKQSVTVYSGTPQSLTMSKQAGLIIVSRAASGNTSVISVYAVFLHNNQFPNVVALATDSTVTVTGTTDGTKKINISTTSTYGIIARFIEF